MMDEVWIMEDNIPRCRDIAVIGERLVLGGQGETKKFYQLLTVIRNRWEYDVSKEYSEDEIFTTKNDLLDSFRTLYDWT